jgi:hypothetical protein
MLVFTAMIKSIYMLLQQPMHLPARICLNCYSCGRAVPAALAHGFGCNKTVSRVDGRIHLAFFAGYRAAEIHVQPNYIAKWFTLCRQLSVMPC